jgi:hypothetical protein
MNIPQYFADGLFSMFYFPIWWYTKGLLLISNRLLASLSYYAKSTALSVWVKNLFVPMFGQRDWQSRIISFVMRVVMILLKLIGIALWSIVTGLTFFTYILFLPGLFVAFVYLVSL